MSTSFATELPTPANDPVPTVGEIEATFAAAERVITIERALGVQRWMRQWGKSADLAVGGNYRILSEAESDFLSYRAARAEAADPRLVLARMEREAKALDAKADAAMVLEAEFAGKAAHRRSIGDHGMAMEFDRTRGAQERAYLECDAQAFQLRLRAAEIEARLGFSAAAFDIGSAGQAVL